MSELQRSIALKVAWSYHGTWYTWGGDDPSSFDCSGFVLECLKSCGAYPRRGDETAEGLRWRYPGISELQTEAGDLVFWLNDADRAVHVGMIVADGFYMGAEGGGPSVRTIEHAIAFVKVRPLSSRRGERRFATPYRVEVTET